MKLTDAEEIRSALGRYQNLSECIVEEIAFRHYGTTIEIFLNYIWTKVSSVRPNLDNLDIVCVTLSIVQEMRLQNSLNEAMCREPNRLNWGFNEVSLIVLEDNHEMLAHYSHLGIPLHHMVFRIGDRRLDVIFSEFEIARVSSYKGKEKQKM